MYKSKKMGNRDKLPQGETSVDKYYAAAIVQEYWRGMKTPPTHLRMGQHPSGISAQDNAKAIFMRNFQRVHERGLSSTDAAPGPPAKAWQSPPTSPPATEVNTGGSKNDMIYAQPYPTKIQVNPKDTDMLPTRDPNIEMTSAHV